MKLSPAKSLISISFLTLALSGCVPVLMGGVGKTVQIASQTRTAGTAMDDIIIETTINNQYLKDDSKDLFRNVDVDVIEGRAFLTGNVKRQENKVKAVDLAWQVKGVNEVINDIQVETTSTTMDAAKDIWIELHIEGRLLAEKNVKSNNYNVESVNGVVTLMGIALSQEELDKVTYIISRVQGVKQVVSHVIMANDPRRLTPKADKPQSLNNSSDFENSNQNTGSSGYHDSSDFGRPAADFGDSGAYDSNYSEGSITVSPDSSEPFNNRYND